jgi:NAD(P)-dependent dehydrogenase (short-subunit alcohol dehydrogenase family)
MFRLCREAIPALKARAREKGRARIVNTASVMAFDTDYGLAAYCASKAGVGGLTRTLALELGKFNITANYVCPGAIYTGMTQTNFDNPEIRGCGRRRQHCAGSGSRSILHAVLFCWPPTRPTSSPATSWWSMAASPPRPEYLHANIHSFAASYSEARDKFLAARASPAPDHCYDNPAKGRRRIALDRSWRGPARRRSKVV